MLSAGTSSSTPANTNLNSIGSKYASTYSHKTTSFITRMLDGVRKKRKSKITNIAPKQFY